tara:strand:+ start:150 stop:377 length:228 start_codon:yes stop_codon:yes gene_type:complete
MSPMAALGAAFVGAVLLVCGTVAHLVIRLLEHARWREKEHRACASRDDLESLSERVEQSESKIRQLQMAKLNRRT